MERNKKKFVGSFVDFYHAYQLKKGLEANAKDTGISFLTEAEQLDDFHNNKPVLAVYALFKGAWGKHRMERAQARIEGYTSAFWKFVANK